jgi:hypothetical protein
MSMPSVIKSIKRDMTAGNSVVIQLVNTNEAALKRSLSKAKDNNEDVEDIDLSPTDILVNYVMEHYPVQQFEEYDYFDERGIKKKGQRPVLDSEGKPVINPELVAERDALIEELQEMKLPDGPLEMILNEFGIDNVAEVTGRKRRVVLKKDEITGEMKRVVESWSDTKAKNDVRKFQNGDKRILVFSGAGSTGASYHASATVKNQSKRIHYLLQCGWSAVKSTQGFGRTHRSNQVVAPLFRLVTTNLKGQKRFISTIARRLDQMGALTKGQRSANSGIFGEKDNLEGPLASDTLQGFFRDLYNNRLSGFTFDGEDILKKMGLYNKLTNHDTDGFKDDPSVTRDVSHFLNRVLNLNMEEQNAVFDAFYRELIYP